MTKIFDAAYNIKCTQGEREAWKTAAAKEGVALNTWVRAQLDAAAGHEELYEILERKIQDARVAQAALMRASKRRQHGRGATGGSTGDT